jgi:hypothetical protein
MVGKYDTVSGQNIDPSSLARFTLELQSHQILHLILAAVKLNQYFLHDCMRFLHFFILSFFRYLKIHFKPASMKTLTNSADPFLYPLQRALPGFSEPVMIVKNCFSKPLMW